MQGVIIGAVETLQDVTQRKEAEQDLRCELAGLEQELKGRFRFESIIGKSSCMQKMYALLENLADTDTTVLIRGESGTGKELVAKALHYSGDRAARPMVTVNCSALTESLLESELFGHVKGAFTGALKDKVGRFELAEGGTILLDEIGDIPPGMQVKLLRILQEKEFERVGESSPRKADVRVLAATNRNLAELVRAGEFREDLYYRLKVVEVIIPPLRERLDDMPLLIEYFISLFNEKYKRTIRRVSKEVIDIFMKHAWPGNVRELEHALEHAFILCHGSIIMPSHLPAELLEAPANGAPAQAPCRSPSAEQVLSALRQAGWNKAKAARVLAVSRPTLYRLIHSYALQEKPGSV
jgi:two-component system, NtrC family, response regulator HydG